MNAAIFKHRAMWTFIVICILVAAMRIVFVMCGHDWLVDLIIFFI